MMMKAAHMMNFTTLPRKALRRIACSMRLLSFVIRRISSSLSPSYSIPMFLHRVAVHFAGGAIRLMLRGRCEDAENERVPEEEQRIELTDRRLTDNVHQREDERECAENPKDLPRPDFCHVHTNSESYLVRIPVMIPPLSGSAIPIHTPTV